MDRILRKESRRVHSIDSMSVLDEGLVNSFVLIFVFVLRHD